MSEEQALNYIDEGTLPFHFCPGCGHGTILTHLNSALERLQLNPRKVVIISDIGCSGLSDKYFATNAFHGLHGRSVTYATGIKLANPDLHVIVLMGDGGCGIGGHHLISAARRNIGVTVLVFNNFNYGMTGGQHSATTPVGGITSTTTNGNIEYPMDICATVSVNGAGFVARTTSFDKDLSGLIVEAIKSQGFSLIDVWELCTAYYVPNNKYSKRLLSESLASHNLPEGIVHREKRPEFSLELRRRSSQQKDNVPFQGYAIESKYNCQLTGELRCVIAGEAGMRIGTAAVALSRGAIKSGLWVTQRNDYPVTVRSGHSVSYVILSPEEIDFPGVSKPDIMVVLFPVGLKKVHHLISSLSENDYLFINSELLPVDTRGKIIALDLRASGKKKEHWALIAITEMLNQLNLYPIAAFKDAVSMRTEFAEKAHAAIEK